MYIQDICIINLYANKEFLEKKKTYIFAVFTKWRPFFKILKTFSPGRISSQNFAHERRYTLGICVKKNRIEICTG